MEKIKRKEFIELIAGVDWGWNDPTAITLYGVTPKYEYYLIDEFYESKKQPEDAINWLKDKQKEYSIGIRYVAPDNARPENNQKLRRAGFTIRDDKPSIEGSISTVRSIINFDRIYQSDKCKNSLNERQTYRYPTEEELLKSYYKSDTPIDEHNNTFS